MTLASFLENFNLVSLDERPYLSKAIGALKIDSRDIAPGDVYLMMPMADLDLARTYQDQARKRGAVLILTPPAPRRVWSHWAKHCFCHQPDICVAVTGTSGKTSVVEFTRQLWQHGGVKAASIGTLGLQSATIFKPRGESAVTLTTPDAFVLHDMLDQLAGYGVQHAALEVSSHGLDQQRTDQIVWSAAAFTNLSHEHLDYHETMEKYFQSKCRLFQEQLPTTSVAVLNRSDIYGQRLGRLCAERGLNMIWFGNQHQTADLTIDKIDKHPQGMDVHLSVLTKKVRVNLPFIGVFQVENILAALGLVIGSDLDADGAIQGLAHLKGVPGRMDYVGETAQGGAVYVDYAHKPLALEHVLKTARQHTTGRVSVVFGCGGNRDTEKRLIMGRMAQRLADDIYITDDNPRDEPPALIRAAILAGCPKALEIPLREHAIAKALSKCKRGDICIIAGKGHELGQVIKDRQIPFNDKIVAQQFLE